MVKVISFPKVVSPAFMPTALKWYVEFKASPKTFAEIATGLFPETLEGDAVKLDPYAVVNPYSKYVAVAELFAFTVPFNTADKPEIFVAAVVVTVGG